MERFKGACTDWTSYVEINRPNCLILGRFAEKQGANRFGRLILTSPACRPDRRCQLSTPGILVPGILSQPVPPAVRYGRVCPDLTYVRQRDFKRTLEGPHDYCAVLTGCRNSH